MGDADDIMEAKLQTLDKLNREIEQHQDRVRKLEDNVRSLERTISGLSKNIEVCLRLEVEVKKHTAEINKLDGKNDFLRQRIEIQGDGIKQLEGEYECSF